jgi:hypothetical protein
MRSNIYWEGNYCADKLDHHAHSVKNFVWWDSLPLFIGDEFLPDKQLIHLD